MVGTGTAPGVTLVERPPYRVPTMAEVAAVPLNGLRVVSTFAGGGGSSTGYRMAGYRVLYANEFVPAALETYRANMRPGTLTDSRDIREVTAEDILGRLNLTAGDLDILDGSPPCASFSTTGKRHHKWGEVSSYSDTAQRSDDLFYEFARLVDGIQPRVFVAENVSGLIKGVAKGYFKRIRARLTEAGYAVAVRVIDAQWLGVPQTRIRVIIIGVRRDLGLLVPAFPSPLPYRYTLRDVLDESKPTIDRETGENISIANYAIGRAAPGLRPGEIGRYLNLVRAPLDSPVPTVTAMGGQIGAASVVNHDGLRKFTLDELRRICGFPPDYVLTGNYRQRWERLGRSVPPIMMRAISSTIATEILGTGR